MSISLFFYVIFRAKCLIITFSQKKLSTVFVKFLKCLQGEQNCNVKKCIST
ncbi:unnamed protein product [Nyctereutes procyonoides]|uniref:(raccoon dog) hypothetical protein n=1 Tax=Nyctereutes procyonoides TaxID=34880 RepID=A0A811Z1C2_NYCPR|nr:unnamed protein product [Nyctereutes procyonoides]